ncbi:hypothetical protein LFL96_27260 [Paraburkholderia sp. D15]|uniref:hypothetical protein n=1 Tax=Paraburkholderia sp. D15 TaxID=2880218 RepID=UPI002479755D|nr:hypothetical protein [Paraburkholderia sp. D15]WGS54705.1 hypothetical protein LFL96_27260 [Paraburkholderia sp. D15]
MIEDKRVATEVSNKLIEANCAIIDALKLVEELCPNHEIELFRPEAANAAGHLFALVLRPLWQRHPDLAPKGLDMSPPTPGRKGQPPAQP